MSTSDRNRAGDDRSIDDRRRDDRNIGNATGPSDSGGIDEREIPLDIRETRDHPDVDEEIQGFQRIIGPGAGGPIDQPDEDFGIPGSEEAGGLGTGPLPPRQPDHPPGRTGGDGDDRIVSDRNVAVDGARDRK
ncbi:hypothetical protein JHL17_01600 [Azospirillum sp. YIM B02556]|uniref:Uncharacterized protein n=1 Tax=Azospirillum endophyticum TaxID=2800326 RepID=A0ABS1EY60_9PROT|nr:hypothetical protein [Azospirillum endophyticum]MBK1836094.1 hypothetical protein [Azospirillum endophyticum]